MALQTDESCEDARALAAAAHLAIAHFRWNDRRGAIRGGGAASIIAAVCRRHAGGLLLRGNDHHAARFVTLALFGHSLAHLKNFVAICSIFEREFAENICVMAAAGCARRNAHMIVLKTADGLRSLTSLGE